MSVVRIAVALLLLAAAAPAQVHEVGRTEDSPREECLSLNVTAVPLAARPGGLGWISVVCTNRGPAAHSLDLALGGGGSRGRWSAERQLRVESGASSQVLFPLPHGRIAGGITASVDGGERTLLAAQLACDGDLSVLVVSDAPSTSGLVLSQAVERVLPSTDLHMERVTVAQLPTSWVLISGADILLLDGAAGVPAAVQQLLLDAASAGALLHVMRPERLREAAGPLAERLRTAPLDGDPVETGSEGEAHGFGWLSAGPLNVGSSWDVCLARALRAAPVPSATRDDASGFPGDVWLRRLEIPGLDDVPTGLFFLLLLGFIVFVAARSVQLLKQRRPLRLLTLLPASGLAMTVGLLTAGLLSEGLGVRGARRSLTMLDQRTHRAAAVCQSSVYAALAAGELQPRSETLATSADLLSHGSREQMPRVWRADLNAGGRVAAGVVPPRTPTQLATCTVGVARERLRFRRVAGGMEVVADAELRPRAGADTLLLRDFDGAWYRPRADGLLVAFVPEDHKPPEAVFPPLSEYELMSFDADDAPFGGYGRQAQIESGPTSLSDLIERLPPGAYVADVDGAPAVDDLGLDVDWVQERHVVVGYLAPDDIDG